VRNRARSGFQDDTVVLRVIWVSIGLLFAVGVAVAVVGSLRTPHPEIVIETCSFAVALLLVMAERGHARHTARIAALRNVVDELHVDSTALFDGVWRESPDAIIEQLDDESDGLRFYYDHLSTAAVNTAVLGGALDERKDADLVRALHKWQRGADICNARLSMAELHFFFLPRSRTGMLERLDVHLTIATDAVAKQRQELAELHEQMTVASQEGRLPPSTVRKLAEIGVLVARAPELNLSIARLTKMADDAVRSVRNPQEQGDVA
jgi:hypothetical protein